VLLLRCCAAAALLCCCAAVLLLSSGYCAAAVLLCCCCAAVLLLCCCAAAEHRDVTESTPQATEARGPTPDVSTPDSESEPGSASLRVSQQRALSQRGVWHPPNLKRQPEDRGIIGPRRKAARRKRQAAEEALRSTRNSPKWQAMRGAFISSQVGAFPAASTPPTPHP
jgi:hypothetical protein